jgi:uncharacterized protein (DUF1684 family)
MKIDIRILLATAIVAASILTMSCASPQDEAPAVDPAYVAELDTWHAERVQRLTDPNNYLTLIGLFWLEEGENGVGSDPSNTVVLPEQYSPDFAGTIVVEGEKIVAKAKTGVEIMIAGEALSEREIASDADGLPDILEISTINFYVLERGGRYAVRVKDPEAETRINFTGIERFPANPKFRIEAEFEAYDPPKKRQVATIIGTEETFLVPGVIKFELDGTPCELYPVIASPEAKMLFLIYSDETNGIESYGAGRFLYSEREKDGRVLIDFNKSVNPPCAFTRYATCPLPPPDNHLNVRIEAGEKTYGNH